MISCQLNHCLSNCNLIYHWMYFSFSCKKRNKVVYISVVFHAPEAHVMIVKLPNGISTSICLRLYLEAFLIRNDLVEISCSNHTVTVFSHLTYCAVKQSLLINASMGPLKTISPPKSPAPGQTSITQSEALIKSS